MNTICAIAIGDLQDEQDEQEMRGCFVSAIKIHVRQRSVILAAGSMPQLCEMFVAGS